MGGSPPGPGAEPPGGLAVPFTPPVDAGGRAAPFPPAVAGGAGLGGAGRALAGAAGVVGFGIVGPGARDISASQFQTKITSFPPSPPAGRGSRRSVRRDLLFACRFAVAAGPRSWSAPPLPPSTRRLPC